MRKVVALASCLITSSFCFAADSFAADTLAGRWEGTVPVPEFPLRVVVDLDRDASGAWIGSIIVPELNINGAPLADITAGGSDLAFAVKGVLADPQSGPARLQGRVEGTMTGSFTQAGNSAAFSLTRTGAAQVEIPVHSTPVAAEFEGKWIGEYELMGYPRHVTLTLANHDAAAASAEFIIVGKKVNNLPVDLITQDGVFLRIESHEIGINFEGRYRKDSGEIDGTYEQGPFEVPFVLHRETGK